MKKTLLIIIILFSALAIGFRGVGRNVKLNFAFHISDNDFTSNDDFLLYARNSSSNVSLSIICVGECFGTQASKLGNENIFVMKQALDGNRFLLGFTNASLSMVQNKVSEARKTKMIGKSIGFLLYKIPGSYPIFLRLEYDDIDILNDTRWVGSSNIIIRNEGFDRVPKISVMIK